MKLTDTQKEFFKNSKVRDNNGDLLVVYHGSKSKGFTEFKYDPQHQTGSDFGEAYYFTTDYQKAKDYTYDSSKDPRVQEYIRIRDERDKQYIPLILDAKKRGDNELVDELIKIKNDVTVEGKTLEQLLYDRDYDTGGEVIDAYLNLTNPLEVDAGGKLYYNCYPEYFKKAKDYGCDGIIVHNVIDNPGGEARPVDVYIAFHPEQIKSVDNLFPTMDRNFRNNLSEREIDMAIRYGSMSRMLNRNREEKDWNEYER